MVAARRECVEETGSDIMLGAPMKTQHYRVDGRPKAVFYWAATERPGGPGFKPNSEIDRVRWLPMDKTLDLLTYPRDGELVEHSAKMSRTSPLVIVRHAQATKRSDFDGSKDKNRPLAKRGGSDARSVSELLDAFGVRRIISSDARRCVDTVRPLAKIVRADIEKEPLFSEGGFDKRPGPALKLMSKILADPRPTVLCTHRPVLPELMAYLAKQSHLTRATKLMNPALEPGEFVVIHRPLSRGRVAVERHSPS